MNTMWAGDGKLYYVHGVNEIEGDQRGVQNIVLKHPNISKYSAKAPEYFKI